MGGKCKFNNSWVDKYPWLKAVEGDSTSGFCKLCMTTFKVDSKGESSVSRHADSDKHKSLASSASTSKQMTNFFKGKIYIFHRIILCMCVKTYPIFRYVLS